VTIQQRSALVVGPSWVGDIVMAQAFFAALRTSGQADAVDVVAPSPAFALLDRMPEVRRAVPLDVSHGRLGLRARWATARRLRETSYDRAFVLPSSFKSALLPLLAGVPVRTGYLGEMRYGLLNDIVEPVPLDGLSDRNLRGYLGLLGPETATAASVPNPRLPVDATNLAATLTRLGLDPDTPSMALAPGSSYGSAKQWPMEHFRELAHRFASDGWSVWVLGGPDEAALGDAIADGSHARIHNLCGRTRLLDAVDLLGVARVTVANDSGLAHIAGAVGSGVVVVYGPTPPAFASPLTDRSQLVSLDLECSPCFERTCPLGHHRCMRDIGVDEIVRRVGRLADADDGRARS
jgi:heptosyltransferase-2